MTHSPVKTTSNLFAMELGSKHRIPMVLCWTDGHQTTMRCINPDESSGVIKLLGEIGDDEAAHIKTKIDTSREEYEQVRLLTHSKGYCANYDEQGLQVLHGN